MTSKSTPPASVRDLAKPKDSQPKENTGYPCPFCQRPTYRKLNVPKQLNVIWYCEGCNIRANKCQCIPLRESEKPLSRRMKELKQAVKKGTVAYHVAEETFEAFIPEVEALEASAASVSNQQRLARIAQIIEMVDNRCMAADGPVTPTLQEMEQSELIEIYELAKNREATQRDIKEKVSAMIRANNRSDGRAYSGHSKAEATRQLKAVLQLLDPASTTEAEES